MIRQRRAFLSATATLLLTAALTSTSAMAAGPAEQYVIELRVIEGERAGASDRGGGAVIDKKLAPLAKDLQTLPFKRFTLRDAHTSLVQDGERVSLEIPSDTVARPAASCASRWASTPSSSTRWWLSPTAAPSSSAALAAKTATSCSSRSRRRRRSARRALAATRKQLTSSSAPPRRALRVRRCSGRRL